MKKLLISISISILAFVGCKKDKAMECWECSFYTAGEVGTIIPMDTTFCMDKGSQIPLFSDINGKPLNARCKRK